MQGFFIESLFFWESMSICYFNIVWSEFKVIFVPVKYFSSKCTYFWVTVTVFLFLWARDNNTSSIDVLFILVLK